MASSRALWTAKLAQSAGGALAAVSAPCRSDLAPVRLGARLQCGLTLGVDPSVRGTGLAVVSVEGAQFKLVESVTVSNPRSIDFIGCLAAIHRAVADLLSRYDIDRAGAEETIYVQNFRTCQLLGCARGAALGPIAAAGVKVIELAPTDIKQTVAGTGRASKEQVQAMVSAMLGCRALSFDEADASAAAIAAAFARV